MQKSILFWLAIFFCGTATAQISLNRTDLANIGDQLIYGTDFDTSRLNSINLGTAAGNQNWDLSALQIEAFDTLKFVQPAGTAFGNLFPNSDMALQSKTELVYFKTSNASFQIDGVASKFLNTGDDIPFDFDPDETIFSFPTNFGDVYNTRIRIDSTIDSSSAFFDSIRVVSVISTNTTFDAWGNLVTRAGTFSSLRSHVIEQTNDTVLLHTLAGWQVFNTSSSSSSRYQWYANGEKFTVAEIAFDQNGNPTQGNYQLGNKVAMLPNVTNACANACNGTISLMPVNGISPFNYSWSVSGVGNNAIAANLCAGNYQVIVTDAALTADTIDIAVGEFDSLSVNAVLTNAVDGEPNGRIALTVSGGRAPYAYSWSNGATTATANNLASGNYSVTITDGNNCSYTYSYDVDNVLGLALPNQASQSWSLLPNPYSGGGLQIMGLEKGAVFKLVIFDLAGKCVGEIMSNSNGSINLPALQSGLYTVTMIKDEQYFGFQKLLLTE